jgi:hypothetical protein
MRVLDGTTTSRVALLTGVAPEDITRLGGAKEQPSPPTPAASPGRDAARR